MAKPVPAREGREPYWRQVVARWKRSGLGVSAFCQSPYRLGGVADRIGRCCVQGTPTTRLSGVGNVSVDSSRYTNESNGSVCARALCSRRAPDPRAGTFRSILPISAPLGTRRGLGRITRGWRHQRHNNGAYGSVVPFPRRGVRATTLLSVLSVRHGSLESPRRKTL
jgi:hypothetical protein